MAGEEISRDLREARRRRLIGPGAVCAFCGELDPVKLMKCARASLLESHHVCGRANEPSLTIVVCRNCHAVETARILDAGVPLRDDERAMPEKLAAVLQALAAFFEGLARICREWADRLLQFVAGLDRDLPVWRNLPEATG